MKKKRKTLAEQILREHEEVKRLMGELEQVLEEETRAEIKLPWIIRFHDKLTAFRDHLKQHFVLEEEGGLMSDIISIIPQAAAQAERLCQDHVTIMSNLDELIKRAEFLSCEASKAFAEFQSRVTRALSAIRNHEAEENELVMSAYCNDVSAAD